MRLLMKAFMPWVVLLVILFSAFLVKEAGFPYVLGAFIGFAFGVGRLFPIDVR